MKKPHLNFWQIWNMSFGFLGIQFGFALQNANVSRIFETLGAKIEDIPILWIAAPITGLLIQPIIGYMSDNTWNRLGRRRPYFLTGAILASLALIIMPNSPVLWVAAGMLWIMDASINVSMEPFRAFVGDMLSSEQRTKGFAMQSFFIGTGAVVGSALPYLLTNVLNIPNTAPEGIIPMSVKLSFYIGAVIFFLAVLWTVISSKEYSPEELKLYSEDNKNKIAETKEIDKNTQFPILNSHFSNAFRFSRNGLIWIIVGLILSYLLNYFKSDKELFVLSGGIVFFGFIQLIAGFFLKNKKTNGLTEIITDMFSMPKTMFQLSFVQFFTWFALFAMWIYTTSAVTKHIYGTTDTTSELFNRGANWVGILFAIYNGFAALVSFLLPILAKYTNRKTVHIISLVAGGISLASIYIIKTPELLILPMMGIGLAWASILSMPYAILAGALPAKKMGVYMGIFNFFIVIPQICAASILGIVTKHLFLGEAVYALVLGGVSMIIAAALVFFVKDVD
ncbi:MAG: MFS transporter [Bacteroidales bacterium]|nr:MFS transporter [Bacteroidales bacterium]